MTVKGEYNTLNFKEFRRAGYQTKGQYTIFKSSFKKVKSYFILK